MSLLGVDLRTERIFIKRTLCSDKKSTISESIEGDSLVKEEGQEAKIKVQKSTSAKRKKKQRVVKSQTKRKSSPKKSQRSSSRSTIIWTSLVVLFVLLIAGLTLYSLYEKPVKTTYKEALNAFQEKNVSAIIASDMAKDFSSGNYTLHKLGKLYPGFKDDIIEVNKELKEARKKIVGIVNGKEITLEEFNNQKALLPATYQKVLSNKQILEEMINEDLLLQEASRLGLEPTQEQLDKAYKDLLKKDNLTEDQLVSNIQNYGLSIEDLHNLIKRQQTFNLLLNKSVDSKIKISDEDVRKFYEENKEKFKLPAQVTVRHILVATSNTRDDKEALARAEEALAKYKSGTDFCTLVTEYSDDKGSLNKCGEYTFGRGMMVPPFENASFEMKINTTRIVKTSFGEHLILKLAENKGRTLSFDEVSETIRQNLFNQRRTIVYQEFIDSLRANATIENRFSNRSSVELTNASVTTLAGENETGSDKEEKSITSGNESAVTETTDTNEKSTDTKEGTSQKRTTTEETTTSKEENENTSSTQEANEENLKAGFASCLSKSGATLYIRSSDVTSQKELSSFDNQVNDLTIVDCDTAKEECESEGIYQVPAWKIDKKILTGHQTLSVLGEATGC